MFCVQEIVQNHNQAPPNFGMEVWKIAFFSFDGLEGVVCFFFFFPHSYSCKITSSVAELFSVFKTLSILSYQAYNSPQESVS